MIKILQRYIAKSILQATALTLLVIVSVLFLITFLGEFKNIGDGDYGFIQAVMYSLFCIPTQLYQFSPMLILLGSIVGLSILSTYRELSVMRTSGFSVKQIIKSVFIAALMLTAIFFFIGETIGPMLSYTAEVRKETERNSGQAVVTATGMWFHVGNNFIHVKHVVGRHLLEGVTRYQFDSSRRLQEAYYAKTMTTNDNNQWIMNDVVKTSFYNDRTKSEAIAQMPWDLKFNANLLNIGLADPSEMSLVKLIRFSRYLEKNGLQASEYKYEFWKRVFQPIATLIMIFLAIPFVLSGVRTMTMGWRIVAGIMIGFVFFLLNAMLGQICIVYQVPVIFAASLPMILFAIIGIVMMRKMVR